MLKTIKKQIDKSLKDYLEKIKKEYGLHLTHPILYKSIKDFALRKGKRIRPLLLILSYQGYAKRNKRLSKSLLNASACMELLHIFMLIDDDIIDRSDLRRGKPTMHRLLEKVKKTNEQEKLGYDLAIVAGDIVYSLAIDAFLSIKGNHQRRDKALKYFVKTAAFTAIGEFIDVLHGVSRLEQIKEKDILLDYAFKTARYTFECPLVIGAILAGAKKKEIKMLSRLGVALGQAFQIQDDILGIFGSQTNIGKSILIDLAESKKTILTSHAYKKLKGPDKASFLRHFNKNKKTHKDLMAVRKILVKSKSLHYSLNKMKSLLQKSHAIYEKLSIKNSYRKVIWNSLFTLFNKSNDIAASNDIPIKII